MGSGGVGNVELPAAYSAAATQHNATVVGYCRTALAAVAGVAAGILGLTGIIGFLFYLMASMVLSLLLLHKTGLEWRKYFPSGYTLFAGLIFSEITTYILCWTFIYGMVHVY
ncbi:ER membrane protein complex subunit 6 [Echinococcus granulosus]|uniref:ER membrane protein complex subunit 6 n=1 Tax=Echinococcus granulosus TaxID=6210 RepID=U6J0V2_ECHGR|nr:Transmembrane protein 93 [Echinococcus granulosus]EUB63431.1 Transmembrane protein 93 [Echinococcus granulosus]KAH9285726.1 ER membrane protein complex subunit 6 [Echinococcus granulosus]CDS16064.1 transmembrane protein 93 [Echinococcus granulosus]